MKVDHIHSKLRQRVLRYQANNFQIHNFSNLFRSSLTTLFHYLLNRLYSIAENIDEFMIFAEFQDIISNRRHHGKKIAHFEIAETNMNYFRRRLVKDNTVGKVGVFSNYREIVFSGVI